MSPEQARALVLEHINDAMAELEEISEAIINTQSVAEHLWDAYESLAIAKAKALREMRQTKERGT